MTPVESPEQAAEFQYNLAHTATHEIVDRTFRAIQTRFRCLDGTKGYLQVFLINYMWQFITGGNGSVAASQLDDSLLSCTKSSVVISALWCAVFPREKLIHSPGLLRSPQCFPEVGIRRLDSGEDGASRAAQEPQTAARGSRQPGRGTPQADHTQTLQLSSCQ